MSQKLTLSIDNITISDEHIIANHFNKCFTSIAGKLLKKIWKSKKTFDSFLKKRKTSNTKTFFLSPWRGSKYIKGIVKRAEPYKCDVCLISRIPWLKRINPYFKRMESIKFDSHQ